MAHVISQYRHRSAKWSDRNARWRLLREKRESENPYCDTI